MPEFGLGHTTVPWWFVYAALAVVAMQLWGEAQEMRRWWRRRGRTRCREGASGLPRRH